MTDNGPVRGGLRGVLGLPAAFVGGVVHTALDTGRSSLRATIRMVIDELTAAVDLTAVIVDNIDLNQLIGAVDLNRVVAQVDLNALIGHLDINALIGRLDLDALLGNVDLDALITQLDVNALIGSVDLSAILEKVDIDTIVAQVDLDRAVEGVDIDAIIGRIDLIGLAQVVIDGVDLPDIIRDASTSVTADVMTDVRGTSERADDAVADLVNRMLRRKVSELPRDG